jgi:hypothetical protein
MSRAGETIDEWTNDLDVIVVITPTRDTVELPDWWIGEDTNVASGWTRCETKWGQGWCHDDNFDGKSYGYFDNWDDAVRRANELGDGCGGITKTIKGYSLRGTRQCIYQTKTISRSWRGLACWTKDYIHEGQKFNPTRNPAIPHREGKNEPERCELAKQYDMESKKEFEVWKANGYVKIVVPEPVPEPVDEEEADDEDEVDYVTHPTQHDFCHSNHSRNECGDPRCMGRDRCFYDCRGCPHIPKNKNLKEWKKIREALELAEKDETDKKNAWVSVKKIQKTMQKDNLYKTTWRGYTSTRKAEVVVMLETLRILVTRCWEEYMLARDKHSEIIKALN